MQHSPITLYRRASGQSLEDFGAALGVNKSTVLRWEANGVPAERVVEIERVTGIPRAQLRPDLFELTN
jgi:DNA-binding transcriptional regulator YdaS (Cro superfamily)